MRRNSATDQSGLVLTAQLVKLQRYSRAGSRMGFQAGGVLISPSFLESIMLAVACQAGILHKQSMISAEFFMAPEPYILR